MYSCPCLVGLVLGISSPNSWTQQPHEPLGIACLIPGMRGSGCWVGSEMTTNGHDQQAKLIDWFLPPSLGWHLECAVGT